MTTTLTTTTPILEVDGATRRAADGTALLDDVSFEVEAGWLVAVVGPTGAGKTSLAKALLGQLSLDTGTVVVHGLAGRGRVAGVPQDDATHAQLSLRRTLDHAVALRSGATPGERRRKVDSVLTELGLASRSSTPLAHLSGGERKRANVAVELLGDPDLLVLDEPTAGLDPAFERSVFASLRSLADSGRTIVAITHSMQVLTVCDRVLFLAPGGTVAFYGSPDDAASYFDWKEPADAYAALSTEPDGWRERFASHRASHQPPPAVPGSPRPPVPAPPWCSTTPPAVDPPAAVGSGHLGTLLLRSWHLASSDRRALALTLAAGPLLGLLLFAVLPGGTLQRAAGPDGQAGHSAELFAFFLAMTVTWLGAAGAAREVVKERHIVRRERLVGVSLSTYLSGKVLFLSAATAVQVVPLAGIALIRQHAPGRGPALGSAILEILVVAVVVGVAAVATGLLVSTWATTSEKAMTVLPVVLIAQLALAGPWAEGRGAGVAVMRVLVPARWAEVAVRATVDGDAGRFWLGLAGVAGLALLQMGAALVLLRHTSTSPASTGSRPLDDINTRLEATSPGTARLIPVGIAVVVAVAAGFGALRAGSNGGGLNGSAPEAAGPAPTPAAVKVTPTAGAVPPTTLPAPPPPPPVAPTTTPVTTHTTPSPTLPRVTNTIAPRATPAAPSTPTTSPPPLPATASAPPTSAPRPVASTATYDPFALPSWILQQVLQPPARR